MSIRQQLLLAVAVPFLGLVILATKLIYSEVNNYWSAQHAQTSATKAVALTALVDALQKERAQTEGFLSSDGARFGASLTEARLLTDQAYATVLTLALKDLTVLQGIEDLRTAADALSITVKDAEHWYSDQIGLGIKYSEQTLLDQNYSGIVKLGTGFAALAEAKEAAALQEAAGVVGLTTSTFGFEQFLKFNDLTAVETQLLAIASLSLADFKSSVDYGALRQSTGLDALRTRIASAVAQQKPTGIEPTEWYDAASSWIDELRGIEVMVGQEIKGLAALHAAQARNGLIITMSTIVLVATIAVWFGLKVNKSVNGSFQALQNAMRRLGMKDFDMRPRRPDLRTEVGRLFEAIDQTRDSLRVADEALAAQNDIRQAVLGDMQDALDALAARNLMCDVDSDFPEEYASLKSSFNTTLKQLRDALQGFQLAVLAVEHASMELDHMTSDMSDRTNAQARSLEETNIALTRITERVIEANGIAKKAKDCSQELIVEAENGRELADQTLPVMHRITEAAERMEVMVTIIDDIAFNTNMLALNAGVEAARAGGEAGKSFAVVAAEVRALAAKASNNATDIKSLISETIDTVAEGRQVVEKTVQALIIIDDKAQTSIKAVERIAQETEAQSTSISEIKSSMNALDDMTQKNTGMVKKCSDMATQLGSRARDASENVGSFVLPGATDQEEPKVA